MLVLEVGLVPFAESMAVVETAAVGAYWTVTLHDLPGPRAVPVQASAVIVNVAEPESEALSMPVAEPPELVSTNVCESAWLMSTAP